MVKIVTALNTVTGELEEVPHNWVNNPNIHRGIFVTQSTASENHTSGAKKSSRSKAGPVENKPAALEGEPSDPTPVPGDDSEE